MVATGVTEELLRFEPYARMTQLHGSVSSVESRLKQLHKEIEMSSISQPRNTFSAPGYARRRSPRRPDRLYFRPGPAR
jgi:hypothetical protein